MAIRRTEERLGAFSLIGHLSRLMGFISGKRRLLVLFALLSVLQAGLELSLPLIVRSTIDQYIMPAWARLDHQAHGQLQQLPPSQVQHTPDGQHLYCRWADLPTGLRRALTAQGLLDKQGWHRLEDQHSFVSEQELSQLPRERQRAIRAPDRSGVMYMALLYAGLLLLVFGLAYSVSYGLNHLGQSTVLRARKELWARLLHLPVRYFDENPVGRLVTRVANDPANLSELFSAVLATALADVVLFVGVLVLLFRLDAQSAAWLLLLAPGIIFLSWWFKRASQRIHRKVREHLAQLNTTIQESYSGLQVIRSFVNEGAASERFEEMNQDYYRAQVKLVHVFSVFRPLIDVFGTLGLALIIWYGGGRVIGQEISLGTLVAFLLYLRLVFRPLQSLADKFNILQSSVISAERLLRIFDTPAEPEGGQKGDPSEALGVEFERVNFSYEAGQAVLHDISFKVAPGEKVALVGPTGSGKSTIISLLLGFYPLASGGGSIRIAGRELADWDLGQLRQNFALVQQDLFLFAGDLARNISLFSQLPPQRLQQALAVSRMDRVLDRLPDGLKHQLNERGTVLSQGERQLVSLARALACGGPLLVLDEATSSVDSATESLIQDALKELLRERTALVVAHRLSTVQSADRILVIRAGRIVEQGNHDELIEQDGHYACLYRTQLSS